MTAYRELIERLERTSKPDRELDALLIAKLFAPADASVEQSRINGNWCIFSGVDRQGRKRLWEERPLGFDPTPTGSIHAALSLVEKMLPGHNVSFIAYARGGASAALEAVDVERLQFVGELGPTPALAILTCLLRALEAQSKDKEEGE